jgi:hypothetical protein
MLPLPFIRSGDTNAMRDVAIDDQIRVINYLKRVTQSFPIEVPTGKAFEAQITEVKP